jgi:hypothetical protein
VRVTAALFLVIGLAATVPAQTRQGKTAASSATGPITMQGCIAGGRAAYTFTQSSTGTTFTLQGRADDMAALRGKLVEVTGTQSPPPGTAPARDLPQFAASKTRVIADQCPLRVEGSRTAQPGGTEATVPESQNPTQTTQQPSPATPRYQPPGGSNQTAPPVGNNPNAIPGATGTPSPGTGNPPATPPSAR